MIARFAKVLLLTSLLVAPSQGAPARRGARGMRTPVAQQGDDFSMPVTGISVNSRVLPKSALRDAARASGIHDKQPPPDAPARLVAGINAWYQRNGYVFARVTARSPVAAGRLRLVVSEPKVAMNPVNMTYYAPASDPKSVDSAAVGTADPDAETASSPPARVAPAWVRRLKARAALRQPLQMLPSAKAKVERLQTLARAAEEAGVARSVLESAERRIQYHRRRGNVPTLNELEAAAAAGTLITVGGITKPRVVQKAMGLKPGEPFRWDPMAWEQLRRCGLFEAAEAKADIVAMPITASTVSEQQQQQQQQQQQRKRKSAVFIANGGGADDPFTEGAAEEVDGGTGARGAPAQSMPTEQRVLVSLSVVEKDARPRRPSQHCRIEPGIALSGGRVHGEVAVHDHNLAGRNQQLKLDVSIKNRTEIRCSLADARLGSQFGFSARAFQRAPAIQAGFGRGRRGEGGGGEGRAGGRGGDAGTAVGDAAASEAVAPLPTFAPPLAGCDVLFSGRICNGGTIGFGTSAELVPMENLGAQPEGQARRRRDLPLLLNANIGCGSMQAGGMGGGGRRDGIRMGARLGVSRSLPFLVKTCPDYWRIKCDAKTTVPMARMVPARVASALTSAVALAEGGSRAQDSAGTNEGSVGGAGVTAGRARGRLRRLRREPIGAPAVAAEPAPASAEPSLAAGVSKGREQLSAALVEAGRKLYASKLTARGKATLAADSLPAYEAEALGGDGAVVRGYELDELGRTHSSLGATVELMIPLVSGGQPIGLALFADAGGGTVQLPSKDEMQLKGGVAAGFGVRYGPFRIDYAFNHEGRKKVHVGLVQD